MRRWLIVVVGVLAVLDLAVLAMGYQARAGALPGWGVPEPAFTMLPPGTPSGSPNDSSTGATTETITGPVLMAVDADGLVLRATRGACQERFGNPATVAVGKISTGVTAVEIPALTEVLGVAILPDDHLRVSGLQLNEASEECDAVTFDSTDSGQTWKQLQAAAAAGIWRFDPDTTAFQVTGPADRSFELGCVPLQIANLPRGRAAVSCPSGAIFILAPQTAPVSLSASGYDDLSVAAGPRTGRYYVFGSTLECSAQVGSLTTLEQSVGRLECLDPDDVDGQVGSDKSPLAIAAAGVHVVVQLGNDLMASDDGGHSFTIVG